jgi:hypothetical protein
MWHKSDFEGNFIRECYKTRYYFDKEGRVKPNFTYDDSKRDVILLGDSYIEALMVKNRNIIHNALYREFNGKYNFLNYGISASGPIQQFVILKEMVNLKRAKYILEFINLEGDLKDADSKNLGFLQRPNVFVEFKSLNEYKIIPPREKNFFDPINDWLGNMQIYFYIKKALYTLKNYLKPPKKGKKTLHKKDMSKNWLYLKGSIYQIAKLSKDNGARLKLIIRSKEMENRKKISEFLDKEGIEYIFLDQLMKRANLHIEHFKCDKHWNDTTHINIAKAIKRVGLIKP